MRNPVKNPPRGGIFKTGMTTIKDEFKYTEEAS
jgi:hypothetical protein